jgi:hypothetical protein
MVKKKAKIIIQMSVFMRQETIDTEDIEKKK